MRSVLLIVAASASLLGCMSTDKRGDGYKQPILGTTAWIGNVEPNLGTDIQLDIMTSAADCDRGLNEFNKGEKYEFATQEERIAACLPQYDRASGQMKFSFRLKNAKDGRGSSVILPVEKDALNIYHRGQIPKDDWTLIPHDKQQPGQLYLLVIDSSGSMQYPDDTGESTRWVRVLEALHQNAKVFIRKNDEEIESAVALLQFDHRSLRGINNEKLADVRVIEDVKEFRKIVTDLTEVVPQGGTALYSAAKKAVTSALANGTEINRWLGERPIAPEPTVVLLTDGFNTNTDTGQGVGSCGANAPFLTAALTEISNARRGDRKRLKPKVYTVGFGTGFFPEFDPPPDSRTASPEDLCGQYLNNRLGSSGLDRDFIDNASLEWLAMAGGGRAFIEPKAKKLKEVFKKTAPTQYSWYTVRYKQAPFYHRKAFDIQVDLASPMPAQSSVRVHPSAWLDAPSGSVDDEGWFRPSPLRYATAVALPLMSFLVFMGYVGAALLNGRRAVTRRSRRVKKSKK